MSKASTVKTSVNARGDMPLRRADITAGKLVQRKRGADGAVLPNKQRVNTFLDKPTPEETAIWQRRLASQANDRAWALAEASARSAQEDEEMLQAAHAAMYLWKIVGNDKNRAHAAQLLAHAYALLGLGHPAKHYLAQAQPLFFGEGAQPWELALAHAVAANVAAANRDGEAHEEHYANAVRLIEALAEAEDRKILSATLRIIPVPGHGPRAS